MSTLNLKTSDKKLKNDHYQTPFYALYPLLKIIPKSVIWDCACGDGNIVKFFRRNMYYAIGTDILAEFDFLYDYQFDDFDFIVTNPPFSLKTEFLERATVYRKPFAFLMNITSLETARRQKVFKRAKLQLLLPNKRISYIVDGKQTKSSWFYSAWFMFGFDLPNDINYVNIER